MVLAFTLLFLRVRHVTTQWSHDGLTEGHYTCGRYDRRN